jgi:hypothetical protein
VGSSPACPRSDLCVMFSYELFDGGLDYESIGRIHRGEFDEWISALARAGLFTNEGIRSIEQQWRDDPRTLLDALLSKADEVTVKRYQDIWVAHGRPALDLPIEVSVCDVACPRLRAAPTSQLEHGTGCRSSMEFWPPNLDLACV